MFPTVPICFWKLKKLRLQRQITFPANKLQKQRNLIAGALENLSPMMLKQLRECRYKHYTSVNPSSLILVLQLMLLADSGNIRTTLSCGGEQQEKPVPCEEKNYIAQTCMHFITQSYSTISSNVDEEAYSNSATQNL